MNTPKSKPPKRYDHDVWSKHFWSDENKTGGNFSQGIANADAAIEFSVFITSFTHVESMLEKFSAFVLGVDRDVAIHISRSIVSAKARIDLLTSVLERARRNSDKTEDFDKIIYEFKALNKIRNNLVHAFYKTNMDTGEVSWLMQNDDPLLVGHAAYVPFDLKIMRDGRSRMHALMLNMAVTMGKEQKRLRDIEASAKS